MKPLFNRVLVEIIEKKDEVDQKSGFVIPKQNDDTVERGRIIDVGTDIKDEPMELQIGQVVYFQTYNGVYFDNKKKKVINQRDLLASDY